MSHSENYVDTGRTTIFYQGVEMGVKQERERIVKLLENRQLIFRDPVAYDAFIALITGEENND